MSMEKCYNIYNGIDQPDVQRRNSDMYQAGDLIMYASTGVCRVQRVGTLDGNPKDSTQYYTLDPVFDTETIYTPVDTKLFMRPVMTKEQAQALIVRIPDIPHDVCGGCDGKLLSERYRACLNTHKNDDLIRLIKSVYLKNEGAIKAGRYMGQVDQQYMKRAEKLLYGELAVALGMDIDQIEPYIKKCIEDRAADDAVSDAK